MNEKLDRIPCVYKNKTLSPITRRRAFNLVKNKLAIYVYDKHLGCWYLKLKKEPSDVIVPKLVLGIDTGTMFTGVSVVGEYNSHNYEFEHTKIVINKNNIKNQSAKRRMYRRMKRGRLRHRESRFLNRTGRKISKTINYYYQNHINLISWLFNLYPIQNINIEYVASVHNKLHSGGSCTPIEIYQNLIMRNVQKKYNINISFIKSRETRTIRGNDHFKTKNKALKNFSAHCVDSHAIASYTFGAWMPHIEKMIYICRKSVGIDRLRRVLSVFKKKQGAKPRGLSKLKRIRYKIDDRPSNHGPWKYIYTNPVNTYPHIKYAYGSSFYLSTRHNYVFGQNKYKTHIGYEYYSFQYIK